MTGISSTVGTRPGERSRVVTLLEPTLCSRIGALRAACQALLWQVVIERKTLDMMRETLAGLGRLVGIPWIAFPPLPARTREPDDQEDPSAGDRRAGLPATTSRPGRGWPTRLRQGDPCACGRHRADAMPLPDCEAASSRPWAMRAMLASSAGRRSRWGGRTSTTTIVLTAAWAASPPTSDPRPGCSSHRQLHTPV